ncbi:MAG TPA: twin-arginine translocation signal domain-containing protein [Actinomycetota bacterium]
MNRHHGPDRRSFIKGAAAAAAALVANPRMALAGHPVTAPASVLYSEVAWRGLVGERFKLFAAGGAATILTLDAVSSFPPPGPGGSAFGLRFLGPVIAGFAQGTYPMHHRALGSFEMFVTPGGPAGPAYAYLAMVNRLTP